MAATSAEEILSHSVQLSDGTLKTLVGKQFSPNYWVAVIVFRNSENQIERQLQDRFGINRNMVKKNLDKDPAASNYSVSRKKFPLKSAGENVEMLSPPATNPIIDGSTYAVVADRHI